MSANTSDKMPTNERATPMKLMILKRDRRKKKDRTMTLAIVKLSSNCTGIKQQCANGINGGRGGGDKG